MRSGFRFAFSLFPKPGCIANMKKPNIVVIQADQMSAKALSVYGHPLVKTPNIDRLAQRGTVFQNAYCNFPLCVPSRASMLAGRYANAISVWDNATEMPASIPTLTHWLRQFDYHTVLSGKMHFIGPDQLHGFNERITTDVYPSNFAWTPDWIVGERYRPTGINMRAVVDAGICTRSLQIDYDEEVEFAGVQKLYDLARYNDDKPFMHWISFTHPHSPYVTLQNYWDLYSHDEIPAPTVPAMSLEDMDTMSRWLYYAHGGDLHDVTDQHIQTARHAYFGMCSYIDDKVGRILDTLELLNIDSETVVVFTSDHGEMLGERGMWFKQAFFEWSAAVPLIISIPGVQTKGEVSELVSLVDLLPTFVDLAGDGKATSQDSLLDGNSLLPIMSGQADWDNKVVSEYTGEGVNAPCRMVRRDDLKLIYTHGHPSMLFDLAQDPHELENLIDHPDYAKHAERLHAEVMENWDPDSIHQSCLESQSQRQFIQKATDGEPNWAYCVRPEDGQRFVRNASAVGTKAKARYPYIEPTPFLSRPSP